MLDLSFQVPLLPDPHTRPTIRMAAKPARAPASPIKTVTRAGKPPRKSAPAVLDRDPAVGIAAIVRDTYLAFKQAIHAPLREHGITTAQWQFLRVLWHREGLNQNELSARLRTHPSNTVSALHLLERNGYVRRERSDTDRRNAHVFLTPKGRALEKKLIPHAAELSALAVRGMSKSDVATLKKLLSQMMRNLDGIGRTD